MSKPFDPKNVQGDLILGLQKTYQAFVFLNITSALAFRKQLATTIHDMITTTEDVEEFGKTCKAARAACKMRVWLPNLMTNIAFSANGLRTLGLQDADIPGGDTFKKGQVVDAGALGDPVDKNRKPTEWEPEYVQAKVPIDAVILITGMDERDVDARVLELTDSVLAGSAKVVKIAKGFVRSDPNTGREHFGFQDGLTAPKVNGFNATPESAKSGNVDVNVILTGYDSTPPPAPQAWTKDGSFLAFRQLRQLVPEFNAFLVSAADPLKGIEPDFIGARMMGRWKSGAPIDLAPLQDDETIATDPLKRQAFDFSGDLVQERCPYASHARKTNPRDGMGSNNPPDEFTLPHLIVRAGIPYGPEVSGAEHESGTSDPTKDRGLLFVSYQSHLEKGFSFVQKAWCNNQNFPGPDGVNAAGIDAGFDLIIGQKGDSHRVAQGIHPGNPTEQSNEMRAVPRFVVPIGGEYFFSPSLDAIKNKLGAVSA